MISASGEGRRGTRRMASVPDLDPAPLVGLILPPHYSFGPIRVAAPIPEISRTSPADRSDSSDPNLITHNHLVPGAGRKKR